MEEETQGAAVSLKMVLNNVIKKIYYIILS